MNRLGKFVTVFTCAIGLVTALTSCGSNLGGSSSYEKAANKYFKAHSNGDVSELKESIAPNEYWEYLEKKKGLAGDKLFYEVALAKDSDEFKERVDRINESNTDVKIESVKDCDNDVISRWNEAFSSSGIDSMIDEVLYVRLEGFPSDGYAYHFDDDDCWFFTTYYTNLIG